MVGLHKMRRIETALKDTSKEYHGLYSYSKDITRGSSPICLDDDADENDDVDEMEGSKRINRDRIEAAIANILFEIANRRNIMSSKQIEQMTQVEHKAYLDLREKTLKSIQDTVETIVEKSEKDCKNKNNKWRNLLPPLYHHLQLTTSKEKSLVQDLLEDEITNQQLGGDLLPTETSNGFMTQEELEKLLSSKGDILPESERKELDNWKALESTKFHEIETVKYVKSEYINDNNIKRLLPRKKSSVKKTS